MSIRLIDIAKITGFSVSTVSRVLHSKSTKYKISEETKKRIQATAKELGYRPNILARGLKLKNTHNIGLIVPDVSNPFFATLVKSIGKELRKSNYSLILSDSDENISIEQDSIHLLLEKRVEGLIIASVGIDDSHLKDLNISKTPVVIVDRYYDELIFDTVCVNNYKGAYLGTQYLIREGHRRIAFVQGLQGTSTNDERLQGYKDALKEANIPNNEKYIVGDDCRSLNGYLQTKTLLNLDPAPTAIFTAGDLIALGAFQAIKEENLHIPTDISIATFDDPSFASHLSPPLTAVRQPINEMGIITVKLVLNKIENSNRDAKKIVLEPQLVVRNSVLKVFEPVIQKSIM